MKTTGTLLKKTLKDFGLAQIVFDAAVLQKYAAAAAVQVMRTNTVGRVKAATWFVDFGIAPDETTIHVALSDLAQKLPEAEREHWLSHAEASRFSENYLRMQSSHACIDDGGLRPWGEAAEESLFD